MDGAAQKEARLLGIEARAERLHHDVARRHAVEAVRAEVVREGAHVRAADGEAGADEILAGGDILDAARDGAGPRLSRGGAGKEREEAGE